LERVLGNVWTPKNLSNEGKEILEKLKDWNNTNLIQVREIRASSAG
jgi:hypothetical protein